MLTEAYVKHNMGLEYTLPDSVCPLPSNDAWYAPWLIIKAALASFDPSRHSETRVEFEDIFKYCSARGWNEHAKTGIGTKLQWHIPLNDYQEILKTAPELIEADAQPSQGDLLLRAAVVGARLLGNEPDKALVAAKDMVKIGEDAERGNYLYRMYGGFFIVAAEIQRGSLKEARKLLSILVANHQDRPMAIYDVNLAINFAALFFEEGRPEKAYKLLWSSFNLKENISKFRDLTSWIMHHSLSETVRAALDEGSRLAIERDYGNRELKALLADARAYLTEDHAPGI